MHLTVAAFYRFVRLRDLPALREAMLGVSREGGLKGTILLAEEGINGTVAGPPTSIERLLDHLQVCCGLPRSEVKFSQAQEWPFARMKVRIRSEIITMRAPEADPSARVGSYVEASDWNAVIADPATLVLDTRNAYETAIGSFEGAQDPGLESFTDFKAFVERELDPAVHRRVAMFCTGGIRCEKASSYMLAQGFEDVLHLKGGILKYLETVPAEESRWLGDCYVFDGRVAVGHGLSETEWSACFGCGRPLSAIDRADDAFEEGVSCPACHGSLTPEKAEALRERQRQITSRS